MADLTACGSPANVFIQYSCGGLTSGDWNFNYDSSTNPRLHVQNYDGSNWNDAVEISPSGGLFAVGGVAAGTFDVAGLLKWQLLTGSVTTSPYTVNLSTSNKVFAVLGALYNANASKWDVYDDNNTGSGNGWFMQFTRAGGGDSVTLTFGTPYINAAYKLLVFTEA